MTEQEARAEAERRYPNDRYEGYLLPGAIRNARREAFEKGAGWERSRVVVAAPSDTDRKPDADEAARIARAATAHNAGETVYEVSDTSGILRLRMSSWPRAKEAVKGLADAGYRVAQDGNEVMVLAAPAVARTSQPVQVEVTDKMLKRAEIAHHEYWCGANPDHNTRECEGGIPRGLLRVLLSAALGGGE